MMKKIFAFFTFNNAIPLAAMALTAGAGITFAATLPTGSLPAPAPAAQSEPAPPDTSYLVSKDLSAWSPSAQITGVTEDADNYYVVYEFSTIALAGAAWGPAVEEKTLTVPKAVLGSRDLGLFVAGQLKDDIQQESADLAKAQEIERGKLAQTPQTAGAYGALIGKALTGGADVLPGYTPVVTSPAIQEPAYVPPAQPAPQPQEEPAQVPAHDTQENTDASSTLPSSATSTQAAQDQDSGSATSTQKMQDSVSSDDASSTPAEVPSVGDTASSTPQSDAASSTSAD